MFAPAAVALTTGGKTGLISTCVPWRGADKWAQSSTGILPGLPISGRTAAGSGMNRG